MRYQIVSPFAAVALSLVGAWRVSRAEEPRVDVPRNQIVVSPQGPRDGGDFGPHTPGTRTSGLQEALDAAKKQGKDVYLAGGSWTAGESDPVVFHLHETLRVPWMQDFRLDSGHSVLNYTPKKGDAIVFDSQMSCSYRLGLVVSQSDGAVLRLRPQAAGPDRFKVITSTEITVNALVGGGGAWPGGEAYKNELDPSRDWKGVGLWLDAQDGPIDGNKIMVVETVGCDVGLLITGAATRNAIEEVNIHLCRNHVQIGEAQNPLPNDNRVEAFMDSQGIEPTSGARIFGARNWLVLSTRQTPTSRDLVFEAPSAGNIALVHSAMRVEDHSQSRTNRVIAAPGAVKVDTPAVPAPGQACRNPYPFAVEARIVDPGRVQSWAQQSPAQQWIEYRSGLFAGQSIRLGPGDSVRFDYSQPHEWRWKAIE
jgi:hypothetical protein